MNKFLVFAAIVVGIVVSCVAVHPTRSSTAEAGGNGSFGVEDLRGEWGYVGLGAMKFGTSAEQTGAVVGRMTLDGNGNGTHANWHNWVQGTGGELEEKDFTYDVESDGTGVIWGGPGGTTEMYRFVLVDSKRELYLIDVRPGNVRARIAKKQ